MKVLITGTSQGIGKAIAALFLERGHTVIGIDRQQSTIINPEYTHHTLDIRDYEALPEIKDVDILINNAGVLDEGLKAIDSFTDEDMNRVIDINTKGTMCMTREVSVEMAKTGYGSIVNVASVAGVMGCGGAAYVASKAAVIGVTRHTALRFAGTNIRCNAICPGTIVTPMVAGMSPANMDMNIFGQMMKHNDLKVQPCMPDDVANMLLFFASDESRAITGQSIVTDFGSTL